MSDKECFWNQHDNIPPNVIGIFENDIMNGRVVSVPRPSEKQFDYTIEWDTSHLLDGFTIAKYHIFTSVANTHAQKFIYNWI